MNSDNVEGNKPGHHSPEYRRWGNIKQRTTNPNNPDWIHYGGRGIKMCDRWQESFKNFHEDVGPAPPGKSLDRIDNDGDYEPGNVRWTSQNQQRLNSRQNQSNHPGVHLYFDRKNNRKRWNARMVVNRKIVLNRYCRSLEEAVRLRKEAEIEYGITNPKASLRKAVKEHFNG